jgi:hypothetical protein
MTATSNHPINPRRIALIGFGEVGQRFGAEFLATGRFDVATYEILSNDSPDGAARRDKARERRSKLFPRPRSSADRLLPRHRDVGEGCKSFKDEHWRDILDKLNRAHQG